MQLLEGTAVSDIDIYAGLGGGKKRVRRDDGTQTNEAFVLVIDVPVPTQGFFKYKQYGIVV